MLKQRLEQYLKKYQNQKDKNALNSNQGQVDCSKLKLEQINNVKYRIEEILEKEQN